MNRSFVPSTSVLLACLSVACGYDNGDRQRVDNNVPVTVSGSIDTGKIMENVDSGIGVFVEYATGGNWKLQVGCDTATTRYDCLWDIIAYTPVGGSIASSQAIHLNATEDLLTVKSNGELNLVTTTSVDVKGVSFVTEPGEPVTFDLVLDGEAYPEQYFYYISNGAVVEGAASPIIELTPTSA